MTPRDNPPPSSTSVREAVADVLNERATPQHTVLSTVWEGPSDDGAADDDPDGHTPELDAAGTVTRSRLVGWLSAPVTRRRALLITVAAAVVCGGVLAVGEIDRAPVSPSAPVQDSAAATQGSLSSRAVVTDDPDGTLDGAATDAAPVASESLSADERLRLTANPVESETGIWMLEAQVVDSADSSAIVQFTVNGAVLEEVDRVPYRLLLTPELLALLPEPAGDGQPLIVTASAKWHVDGVAASPATLVLPN